MDKAVSKENSDHYFWGDNCEGWHLLKNDDLSVIQERVPAGKFEKRHYHKRSKQFFYILQGVATIEIEGEISIIGQKEGICINPGASHQLMNNGDADLEFIVISSPKSHGDRIES